MAACDGSYCPNTFVTTAGWILESEDGSEFISGVTTPSFSSECNGSYRAEISGILAIIHLTTFLPIKHDIGQISLVLGCDNTKALDQCFCSPASSRNPKQKHSNLLSAVSGLLLLDRVNISFRHIKAHQDDVVEFDKLPRMAKMNVRMDWLAKAGANLIKDNHLSAPKQSSHPLGFMAVSVHSRPVLHCLSSTLYNYISDKKIHEWWLSKDRYNLHDIPLIHWGICTSATATLPPSTHKFAAKWTSGHLGTGEKMVKWQFRPSDECPFCSTPGEDTAHILLCQHSSALEAWDEQLKKFASALQKWETHPSLMIALVEDLNSWRKKQPFSDINFLPTETQNPILHCRQLTYLRFLEGLIPKSMISLHNNYYRSKEKCRKTGTTCGKKVYKLCWQIINKLWIERNNQLHQTSRIDELQGLPQLCQSIRAEYALGLHRLPACEFSLYFSIPLETMLSKSTETLRTWLQTIRLGRELHGGIDVINDCYSSNGPSRSWLGLPKLQN